MYKTLSEYEVHHHVVHHDHQVPSLGSQPVHQVSQQKAGYRQTSQTQHCLHLWNRGLQPRGDDQDLERYNYIRDENKPHRQPK